MEWFIKHLSTMTTVEAYLWLTGILLLCGLGLPIPEDVSLIAAGYFAYKGVLNVHKALAVCFAAVLAGDTLAFFLGRWFGRRLLAPTPPGETIPGCAVLSPSFRSSRFASPSGPRTRRRA
jgi:membrane protein DedA with SNARE-associated domain